MEVWRRRKQVLQTCDWTNLCHLQRFSNLYLSKQVKPLKLRFFTIILSYSQIPNGLTHTISPSFFRQLLHKYANEDVSLGSWFIGLDVEHIDDRSLCCGTPLGKDKICLITQSNKQIEIDSRIKLVTFILCADCEWKGQAGNPCAASFDWSCSGICKSVDRMLEVHQRCGEGDGAIWHTSF